MGDGSSIVPFIICCVVCGLYYYFVSKVGDPIAYKIEEVFWGERYHWEGLRRTYKHYSVIFAIFFTIWCAIKTGSAFLMFVVFVISSIAFYVAWKIMEDALDTGTDKLVDSVKGVIIKEKVKSSDVEKEEKYCTHCGKKTLANAEFCSYCGTKLNE